MENEIRYNEIKTIVTDVLRRKNNIIVDFEKDDTLDMDSLTTISVIIELEEKYNIELEERDLLFENYSSITRINYMLDKYFG